MRKVDTDALRFVLPSLGIGNPATATEAVDFDDENLQQAVDISRILPGLGLEDGWVSIFLGTTHVASGSDDVSTDPYSVVEFLGGSTERDRIWACGVWATASIAAGNSVDRIAIGVTYPTLPGIFPTSGPKLLLAHATAFDTVEFAPSGGRVLPTDLQTFERPVLLPPGSLLGGSSTATVPAGSIIADFGVLMWAGPRGLRPPGLA